jgi:cytochrome c oxidase assembly protein subunit 15
MRPERKPRILRLPANFSDSVRESDTGRDKPWLYRFSLFVTAATLCLILAGGLVTSHEAGLAVPDWPQSYGQWMPPMVGNVFWEHSHRMIAGTVGILTLILALWVQWQETRRGVKGLAWVALGAVILQAALGGLTVLLLLPAPVSIFHACLAQTFFCLLIALAYFLSGTVPFRIADAAALKSLRRLAGMTAGFVYLQLILGATVRHTGHAVALHIMGAFLVLLHILILVLRLSHVSPATSRLPKVGAALGIMVLVQFFLGIGSFVFTQMLEPGYAPRAGEVVFTAAHQTVGAMILGTTFLIVLRAYHHE